MKYAQEAVFGSGRVSHQSVITEPATFQISADHISFMHVLLLYKHHMAECECSNLIGQKLHTKHFN